MSQMEEADFQFALSLQSQFLSELESNFSSIFPKEETKNKINSPLKKEEIVGSDLELIDPNPDLHAMFLQFNQKFFWGKLIGCEVKWSPRMTSCAGVCSYRKREGYCSIRLSLPLLKLRPRKDFVETLLHEMIHAYLFVTDNNDDRDGHGPEFKKHMKRLNAQTGTNITIYHTFHNEVAVYKQHWWKCDGPCVQRKPFFGILKRSMNRAPSSNDYWFAEHQRSCGGTFHKIKEPEGYKQKKSSKKKAAQAINTTPFKQPNINSFIIKSPSSTVIAGSSKSLDPFSGRNIVGFGGTSYGPPSKKTKQSHEDSGKKLGGGIGSVSLSVNDVVKNAWTYKFLTPISQSQIPSTRSDEEIITIEEDEVNCPICQKKVKNDIINSHLDACLQK